MRFKRRQRSTRAAMRKREAIQPRKLCRAEADPFPLGAGSNAQLISETEQVPSGSKSVRACNGSTCIPGRSGRLRGNPVRAIEVL